MRTTKRALWTNPPSTAFAMTRGSHVRMGAVLWAGVMAIAVGAGCSGGELEDLTDDGRGSAIVNGQVTTGYPAVVNLIIDKSGGSFSCSGTIVSDHSVLTAAHCTIGGTRVRMADGRLADRWDIHPRYDDGDLSYEAAGPDLSVVHFPTALGGGLPIATTPAVGTEVRIVGFGRHAPNAPIDGQKRTALNTITEVAGGYVRHASANNVCSGDSGGAVLDASGGSIIAVISRGPTGCMVEGVSGRADAESAWMRGIDPAIQMGGGTPPPPPPATGIDFSGGHLDLVRDDTMHGWCAVTRGAQKISTAVEVTVDGQALGTFQATEHRGDVKDHIEAFYRTNGSNETLPDDIFGFAVPLARAGRYSFQCTGGLALGAVDHSPSAPVTPDPEFSGGHLDLVRDDTMHGWCAVTRGAQKISTSVEVTVDGQALGTFQASEHRSDVKDHIEAFYRNSGSNATLPDDIFGFAVPLSRAGRYSFQCTGGIALGAVDHNPSAPPPPPPPPPTAVEFSGGHLDRVIDSALHGWCAVTRGAQKISTAVEVTVDGQALGTFQASEHRSDVKDHIEAFYRTNGSSETLPDDVFGFAVPLTREGRYSFQCRGGVALGVYDHRPTPPAQPAPRFASGNIDIVRDGTVHGWCAVVEGATKIASAVDVYLGGRRVGSAETSHHRSDVKAHIEAYYRDQHGLQVTMPDDLFGFAYALGQAGTYEFRCRDGVTLRTVDHRPNDPPPQFSGGYVDLLDGARIHGWCAVMNGAEKVSTEVFVFRNNQAVGSVFTNQHRSDVKAHIEQDYRNRGHNITLPDDLFGFYYDTTEAGFYTFRCADGRLIGGKLRN